MQVEGGGGYLEKVVFSGFEAREARRKDETLAWLGD